MVGGTRVDYWRETLVKRAFIGGSSQAAGAATYASVQLWNPAASGKLLICDTIHITIAGASLVTIRRHNVALTNAQVLGNKYINEADGVALTKSQTSAQLGTVLAGHSLSAGNLSHQFKFSHPLIIGEGLGIHIQLHTVNIDLSALFEWIEV